MFNGIGGGFINILSIDPSIASSGFCVLNENKQIIKYGKIATTKTNYSSEDKRINYICDRIEELINKYNIEEVVLENQFVGNNAKTGLALKKLVGAICRTCKDLVNVSYVNPSQWRKALLNSNKAVNKNDVFKYALDNLDFNEVILKGKNKNDDIIEAVCIGIAYLNKRDEFIEGSKY